MEKTKNVDSEPTDVVDYTDQLIMESHTVDVRNKYCVRDGNTVMVNFDCKLGSLPGKWVKLATLPSDLVVGDFNLWFTAKTVNSEGDFGQLIGVYIYGSTIGVELAVDRSETYRIGVTYVKR